MRHATLVMPGNNDTLDIDQLAAELNHQQVHRPDSPLIHLLTVGLTFGLHSTANTDPGKAQAGMTEEPVGKKKSRSSPVPWRTQAETRESLAAA